MVGNDQIEKYTHTWMGRLGIHAKNILIVTKTGIKCAAIFKVWI